MTKLSSHRCRNNSNYSNYKKIRLRNEKKKEKGARRSGKRKLNPDWKSGQWNENQKKMLIRTESAEKLKKSEKCKISSRSSTGRCRSSLWSTLSKISTSGSIVKFASS